MVHGFGEVSLEYLHDAVGVGMIVDERALLWIPDYQDLLLHQHVPVRRSWT